MADTPVIQKLVRRIRVFVASPGDVAGERRRVSTIIDRVNDRHALQEGILLDPWLWEMDAAPGIGRIQEQINPDLDGTVWSRSLSCLRFCACNNATWVSASASSQPRLVQYNKMSLKVAASGFPTGFPTTPTKAP